MPCGETEMFPLSSKNKITYYVHCKTGKKPLIADDQGRMLEVYMAGEIGRAKRDSSLTACEQKAFFIIRIILYAMGKTTL